MDDPVICEEAPAAQARRYVDGDAIIKQLGLIRLADGEEVMGVLMTFPMAPPKLPFSMAYDGTAFELKPKQS